MMIKILVSKILLIFSIFDEYEQLFDVPPHSRTDNDVSGLAPIYIPAAG